MNIVITAGGTSEPIDNVRKITNGGTGRLGSMIANLFAESAEDSGRIYYLCSSTAIRPEPLPDTAPYEIKTCVCDTVARLQECVNHICAEDRIDAFIHSMAVSDYRVRSVSSAGSIADTVASALRSARLEMSGEDALPRIVRDAILSAPDMGSKSKISSAQDDMILMMEKNPKVIATLRDLMPKALLVGFKLLSDVSEETLIQTAFSLLQKNRLDFVLANDEKSFRDGGHIAHLVKSDASYDTFDGKENIARAIVDAVKGWSI